MPRSQSQYQHKVPMKYMKKSAKKASTQRSRNRTTTMVNRAPLSAHTIVSDRYVTKMSTSFSGIIATPFVPGQFIVYGNSFETPWLTPSNNIGTIVTGKNGSNTGAQMMGYNEITALYNQYRVRASSIKVTCQPTTTGGDSPVVVVFPVIGLFATATGGINQTQNQRYAKWKQCTYSNNTAQNTVINYIASHKAIGLTREQYESSPANQIAAVPGVNLDWYWQVAIYNPASGDFSANVIVTVELDYYVEFSDPSPLTA